jgi:hypothetical protein
VKQKKTPKNDSRMQHTLSVNSAVSVRNPRPPRRQFVVRLDQQEHDNLCQLARAARKAHGENRSLSDVIRSALAAASRNPSLIGLPASENGGEVR